MIRQAKVPHGVNVVKAFNTLSAYGLENNLDFAGSLPIASNSESATVLLFELY